jgi:hypothetical protein
MTGRVDNMDKHKKYFEEVYNRGTTVIIARITKELYNNIIEVIREGKYTDIDHVVNVALNNLLLDDDLKKLVKD